MQYIQQYSENYIQNEGERGETSCARRNCPRRAECFFKLTIAGMAGTFCAECAAELKAAGILEEINQNVSPSS